jgi:hypothetical protein
MERLLICYPLNVTPEAMDDVQQAFNNGKGGVKKVECFIDPKNYPSLNDYFLQYGMNSKEGLKLLLISDGKD